MLTHTYQGVPAPCEQHDVGEVHALLYGGPPLDVLGVPGVIASLIGQVRDDSVAAETTCIR